MLCALSVCQLFFFVWGVVVCFVVCLGLLFFFFKQGTRAVKEVSEQLLGF